MWRALFGIAFLAHASLASAVNITDTLSCQGKWVWETATAQFGRIGSVFDYSEDSLLIPNFSERVETGQLRGTTDALLEMLKPGGTKPTFAALAGPASAVGPLLDRAIFDLNGERLPYLTFLLIGPPELRDSAAAAFGKLGATFLFVPFERHECAERR